MSFNLLLAVQSWLHLASHIIADEDWPPATSLAQTFRRLAEHRVFSPTTATALAQATGLRNFHGLENRPGAIRVSSTRLSSNSHPWPAVNRPGIPGDSIT